MVWTVDVDRRGEGECAFCTTRAGRIGPPTPPQPSAVLLGRLTRDLRRFGSRKSLTWVWLSPNADPFSPAAPELAGPTLEAAGLLLRHDIGVTIRTRGGLDTAAGLVTLAHRHPGMVRVEIGAFARDPELVDQWEQGTSPLTSRVALATELSRAGADVAARIGPLMPLVNDGEQDLASLCRTFARAGASALIPVWMEDAPGLIKQIEREVSRSRARMVEGFFELDTRHPSAARRLPERARRHILRRLHTIADSVSLSLIVCPCSTSLGTCSCLTAPRGVGERKQLDLFAS